MLVISYDNTNHRMQTNIQLHCLIISVLDEYYCQLAIFDPYAISNFPNILFKDEESRYDLYLSSAIKLKDIFVCRKVF